MTTNSNQENQAINLANGDTSNPSERKPLTMSQRLLLNLQKISEETILCPNTRNKESPVENFLNEISDFIRDEKFNKKRSNNTILIIIQKMLDGMGNDRPVKAVSPASFNNFLKDKGWTKGRSLTVEVTPSPSPSFAPIVPEIVVQVEVIEPIQEKVEVIQEKKNYPTPKKKRL